MPLAKGSSKKTISKNIEELTKGAPSAARAKGILTLMKRRGISYGEAKTKQAVAIALSMAKRK